MRTFPDDLIRKLQKAGDLTGKDGGRIRSAKKEPQAKVSITSEERQAKALEAIVVEIKGLLQANSQNAVVLLEIIKKMRMDVQFEIPESAKKWKHTPARDGSGKISEIISEVVK